MDTNKPVIPRFPLADVAHANAVFAAYPGLRHCPMVATLRHIDMATRSDQARVWGLALLMRKGGSVAKAKKASIDFLEI